MIELLLNNLNIKYVILDKSNNVIESTIDGEEFLRIQDMFKRGQRDFQLYKYGENYFKCGFIEGSDKNLFYIQDLTSVVENYQDLKRDSLTKLYIRGIALPLMDEYILQSVDKQESFSMVMGDIDFFKRVNDTYGHDEGDNVLVEVSKIFLNSFRTRDNFNFIMANNKRDANSSYQKDIICRYGGEEFLILLKNINLDNTLKRMEAVRKRIAETTNVTVSFGVINVVPDMYTTSIFTDSAEQTRANIVKIADDCLYHSKKKGRNVVSFYEDGEMKTYNEPIIYPEGPKLKKVKQ